MNTARFCQFHDVWRSKWSFCSEEKETGTTISSRILYWVLFPYEIDTGTLCLLQTRLVHSAQWSGWTHIYIYNKTVEKCQVNNISGTPELDINYSVGGWGRATSGNYVSPHFCGETYCFCPVRLSVTQFVSTTPLKLLNRISWNLVDSKDTICSCAYYQEILIPWILWELCPFELRNFLKFTTEAACQCKSSETTEQNFMKLGR